MSESFLEIGTLLQGQFEIGKPLGHGGFANTYEGWNHVLANKVCIKEYFPRQFCVRDEDGIKVIPKDNDSRNRFFIGRDKYIEEARSVASLHDVSGVEFVYTFFEENETGYIVFEFLDGSDLRRLIKNNRMLPYEECRWIICEVLNTLKEIHSRGVLHRDIAPDNIFITNKNVVKLIDFGSSVAEKDTRIGEDPMLKPGYAPIEQYSKTEEQGTYTDIYAVGALMYRLITGETPPSSKEREKNDTLRAPSDIGIDIPKEAEMALMTALNIKPEYRLQSAEEFLSVFQEEGWMRRNPSIMQFGIEVTESESRISDDDQVIEAWLDEDNQVTEAWVDEDNQVTEAWVNGDDQLDETSVEDESQTIEVNEDVFRKPENKSVAFEQNVVLDKNEKAVIAENDGGLKQKKSKKMMISVIIVLLIVLAGIIGAGVFLLTRDGGDDTVIVESPSVVTQSAVTTTPMSTITVVPTSTPTLLPVDTPTPTPESLIGKTPKEASEYLESFDLKLVFAEDDVYDDNFEYGLICKERLDGAESVVATRSLGKKSDWMIDPKDLSGTTESAIVKGIKGILRGRDSIKNAESEFDGIIERRLKIKKSYSSSVEKGHIIQFKPFNIRKNHTLTISLGKDESRSSGSSGGDSGGNSSGGNSGGGNSGGGNSGGGNSGGGNSGGGSGSDPFL